MMILSIYCDGGARGNPGPAAGAFVVKEEAVNLREKRVNSFAHAEGKYLGMTTNNVAEYQAVIAALTWLKSEIREEEKQINFYLDSNLVVNQLNGRFKVKNGGLRELLLKIRGLEQELGITTVTYSYVPRGRNWEADRLVNETLDAVQ